MLDRGGDGGAGQRDEEQPTTHGVHPSRKACLERHREQEGEQHPTTVTMEHAAELQLTARTRGFGRDTIWRHRLPPCVWLEGGVAYPL
ncbi:hypothetical protein [Nonomuraea endophytica]|uniref:hypothetical protein n=1 Tax=Nonomuraea endophytica TaxID=714136 RepID=UPI0037C53F02